jgi:hypothetical protein
MPMNNWTRQFTLSVAMALLIVAASFGQKTPFTHLRLFDLTGHQIEPLRATHAKGMVFLFIRHDCPISNRYAPEVRRLYEKFAAQGITFWLVYPDPNESAETIRKHIRGYNYRLGVLRDPNHTLVKMAGVRVTPEAVVFIPERGGQRMVYRGRIDDRFVAFGKTRAAPTTHDLDQVLEAILSGKPITNETTTAIGCFISDLR